MNTRYNPKGIWAPNGRAFSQGVVQGDGKVLHITGQVAWDEDSNVVGEGDIKMQLEKSIENTKKILDCVGGKLIDIVSMTIYFLHRKDLPIIQEVRAKHFKSETAPTSILIVSANKSRYLSDPYNLFFKFHGSRASSFSTVSACGSCFNIVLK